MARKKTQSSASWKAIAHEIQFRRVALPAQPGFEEDDLSFGGLLAQGGEKLPAFEETVPVERITLISREFLSDMGGQAPYDRLEILWPLPIDAPLTAVLGWNMVQDATIEERGADMISLPLRVTAEIPGNRIPTLFTSSEERCVTTLQPNGAGFSCRVGQCVLHFVPSEVGYFHKSASGKAVNFNFEAIPLAKLQDLIADRNAALGIASWAEFLDEKRAAQSEGERRDTEFPLHTGEEWTAFMQAAADGKGFRHFSSNEQSGILRHQRPNAAFFTEAILLEEERSAGHGIELLQNAAAQLDVDDGLACLYISHLLAPPAPLAANAYAGGWVDLDDVARKTMGGYARNPKEAAERRAKVWHAILWGARNSVGGKRSVPYFDKTSGREISTEIYTTPWSIVSRQKPTQLPLFGEEVEEAPLRVELVASREWTALTTEAATAQYLPFGEILGALPANQASGAWARILGLAYLNWSRRRIAQALEGVDLPSRQELLDSYPSKVAPFREVLASNNPLRALTYWQTAEALLREAQIIETEAKLYQPKTRKGWQEIWLAQSPDWKPGPLLRPVLEVLATRRFPAKSRSLKPKSLRATKTIRRRRDLSPPE